MSLETSHQSSPWRGSAFSQRFLTSSCCSYEEEKRQFESLLMPWFVPAQIQKFNNSLPDSNTLPKLMVGFLFYVFWRWYGSLSQNSEAATLLPCWTNWPNYSQESFGYTREIAAETSFALPPAWNLSSERSLWSQKINTPIIAVISGSKNCHKRLEQTVPPAVFTCNLYSTLVKKWD